MDVGPFLLDTVPLGLSDHSVLMDVPAGFPKIGADPDRLRQVLTNLVTNAVKYSPAGGSIIVRVRERGTQHVVIEVVDHGLGIPPEQIGRLFQKFARVRSDDHMKVSGTGLGLYICRLIVEGHGGQIWVESEVGKGSTFGLSLPVDARIATRRRRRSGDRSAKACTALNALQRFRRRLSTSDSFAAIATGGLRWASGLRVVVHHDRRVLEDVAGQDRDDGVPRPIDPLAGPAAARRPPTRPTPARSRSPRRRRRPWPRGSRGRTPGPRRRRVSRIARTARSWLAGSPMRMAVATVSASTVKRWRKPARKLR